MVYKLMNIRNRVRRNSTLLVVENKGVRFKGKYKSLSFEQTFVSFKQNPAATVLLEFDRLQIAFCENVGVQFVVQLPLSIDV